MMGAFEIGISKVGTNRRNIFSNVLMHLSLPVELCYKNFTNLVAVLPIAGLKVSPKFPSVSLCFAPSPYCARAEHSVFATPIL